MREWSRRILGQPLFTVNIPQAESDQISPFEYRIVWDLEESNIFEFTFKIQFLSDQFENLLGHRTFFIFEILSEGEDLGKFAFKVGFCLFSMYTLYYF